MDHVEFQEHFAKFTDFKANRFHPLVWINGDPEIGENVYIAGMSEIYAKGAKVVIGDNCDIASFVAINCADSHKMSIGLSDEIERKDIIIENHVFIGSHSVVKGGAHIGHHSVVAAGTIVEGVRIPPYSLVIGNPMKVKEGYYRKLNEEEFAIPHNKPTIGNEEEKAVIRTLRSGWIAQGSEVAEFENEFCHNHNLPAGHAVAVSSGTAALFLALWALNVENREVAIPAYACASLRHAVAMNRSKEILMDSGELNPNINVSDLPSNGLKAAIIPHLFGIPVNLMNLEHENIIEDCAQALGASVNGVPVGLQGKVGIYSFYATKLMTSGGQGGMVVSKDKALIDLIRDYRQFDQREDKKLRFNFQMTDLQASIGRVQLTKLSEFIAKREQIFDRYLDAGLCLLDSEESEIKPVRYRAVLKVSNQREVIDHLLKKGVKSIIPVESWELLGESIQFPNAHQWTQSIISLPIFPTLDVTSQKRIIHALKEIVS
jgi:perosamine synthetase